MGTDTVRGPVATDGTALDRTALDRKLLDRINADAIVALAAALIDAGSENPGGTEAATVDVLVREAGRLGLAVDVRQVAEGRPNILVTLPATPPRGGSTPVDDAGILFLGHSDVVPAGPGWSRKPFTAAVHDGRLYGRGSTDMKGGLASVLGAMSALQGSGVPLSGPVTLACTVDEEDLGLGIRALTAEGLPHRYQACIVAEPTDLETVVGCRGDSYFVIEVTGKAAHSGRPEDGRNAIDAAARICGLLRADHHAMQQQPDELLGAGTWNVGRIEGGRGTSMVAPSCRLWVDRRLMPDDDPATIATQLAAQISDAGIDTDGITADVQVTMQMPGFRTPADHPLVTAAIAAVEDAGGTTRTTGWTAACDGGFIARDLGIPTIVLGPGGLNDQAHQVDESVGIGELITAARAYALLCLRTLGYDGSASTSGDGFLEGEIR